MNYALSLQACGPYDWLLKFVCVFYLLFPRDGSLLFQKKKKNRRDILYTTLLTRITAHTIISTGV